MTERETSIEKAILAFGRQPILAHRALFRHRHPQVSPPHHDTAITAYHSDHPRILEMAFRGDAKSTRAEECIIVKALLQKHRNMVIIGETETRAVERLRAIRNELETNVYIEELFGGTKGQIWGETKLELASGVMIQAYGRGQSLRGAKHRDIRPDFLFGDDLEDQESVATKEAREKTRGWFWQVLIPALDNPVATPIRIAATPLHVEALAVSLSTLPEWYTLIVPIESLDPETGERQSSWPDKFPLSLIDTMRKNFDLAGRHDDFMQEYMCQVADPAKKTFSPGMFRLEPQVRTYQAVYGIYDPARTVKMKTSDQTGKVFASWQNNRLIVWEAAGHFWMPDEIVADMFAMDLKYNPVAIGVEEDGLNEFILQPLRHAQIDRGHPLPVRPLKAPKGKLDFIRSLQPFFKAREVIFSGAAEGFADLQGQLLNFPSGLIDIANALAYFLKMRPGQPIYDSFSPENVAEDIHAVRTTPYLVVNASEQCTAGCLVQLYDGRLSVLADYVREGGPGVALEIILRQARLDAAASGFPLKLVAHQRHFAAYDTVGLRAAANAIPIRVEQGGGDTVGRTEIRSMLERRTTSLPSIRVDTRATWTLRAFTGGYCRALRKDGTLTTEPAEGAYATLMQGLESFVALFASGVRGDDSDAHYEYTPDGRRYLSARVRT